MSRGRKDGFSGALWSTSSTSCPTFRFSMCPCRRWGVIAVPTISLDRSPQLFVDQRRPQRAEQFVGSTDRSCSCPAGHCLIWSWWWERVQQRSPPSRWLKFQFQVEIFKVLAQDTVFRCALLSRSLTFQFRVVVGGWCRSSRFSPSTASSSSPGAVDEAFHGFFRTFPRFQKSAESGRQCGDDGSCRSRRALQLMDVGGF